ncbi:hypothetical protein D3C87_1594760 [compost metagenome]
MGGAVRVDEGSGDHAMARVRLQQVPEGLKGARSDLGVGVEEEDALRVRRAHDLVIGFREAEVLGVGDRLHLRVALGQHLHRAVRRSVIRHPDLERNRNLLGEELLETAREELSGVVIDDGDCDGRLQSRLHWR